tara:strand:+ start:189 stop:1193 length:1005 start_codon:yes stop_codon:yes gene_type:complete
MFDLGKFASLGRNEDDTIAHVATGEMVIRPELLGGALTKRIKSKMEGMGFDPAKYTVGNSANSINPNTMQPEFGFLSGLFGSSGSGKGLKRVENEYLPKIDALGFNTPGLSSPTGNVNVTPDGISLDPTQKQTDTSNMWTQIQNAQAQNLGASGDRLDNAFEGGMSREQLMNLFSQGIPQANARIDDQTDSAISRIFNSRGVGSNSVGLMADAQGAGDMNKANLWQNAFRGAQDAYGKEMNLLTDMLKTRSGLETQDLSNLSSASGAQLNPFAGMNQNLASVLGFGRDQNQFDMEKLGTSMNLANQRANYQTLDRNGIFQNVIVPAVGAYTGSS